LSALFHDLCRQVFGFDPKATGRLVEALPSDGQSVLAIGGYFLYEVPCLPFYRFFTDSVQLRFGTQMRVVWLDQPRDLQRVLLDPNIRRVVLVGHASMKSYAFEGLSGRPEHTLARLLDWSQERAHELAPKLKQLSEGTPIRAVRSYLDQELGTNWRYHGYDYFSKISADKRFVIKDELVVYACSSGEFRVKCSSRKLGAAVRAELTARPDTAVWLGYSQRGLTRCRFEPLCPSMDRQFRRGFPSFIAAVQARLPEPLEIEAAPDFARLLATRSARFPGTCWVHNFLTTSRGVEWDPGNTLRAIKQAIAAQRQTSTKRRTRRF
jgi:hypothetical protein